MREIRLLACLLCLFITSNSSVYAMTMVQGDTGIETDITEDEKANFEKEGGKNESWDRVRNVVDAERSSEQKNNLEEDFDDTKTIIEESDDLNDEADIKSENGDLKRSDSSTTLYEESIDSNNNKDARSKEAGNKNEPSQSGSSLLSVMKARQKLKEMASKGSRNNQKETNSNEKVSSTKKDDDSKKDAKTDLDDEEYEETDDDELEEIEDIDFEKVERKIDNEKSEKAKSEDKSGLDKEDDDKLDDVEDIKSEKAEIKGIKIPEMIKFPLKISSVKGLTENVTSVLPSYRRAYGDDESGYESWTTSGRRNTFSEGESRYYIGETENRKSSLENTLRKSLNLSSFEKDLANSSSDEDNQNQTEDSEIEEAETSTSDIPQNNVPMMNTTLPTQQSDQNMMQNSAAMPIGQNLGANGNMNNQMIMQQVPYQVQSAQQSMPVVSGNIQNNNTNSSFGENFLQNLFHLNQPNQDTSNSETKTRRKRRNRLLSGVQNRYGIGKAGVQNVYRGLKKMGTNLSDSEVVEKVIRYLRDLGVINESKFLKLNLKDIGTCIYCKRFSLLTILDKERKLGACRTCSKQLVNDYLAGKSLGGVSYEANGYRRDSGVDISDDMARGGANELRKEGGLENTLSLGNIASALGSTILNKVSSPNSNEQMGQNAFEQPLMQGALMPGQIAGGGLVADPQLMNQPGVTGMPMDQTALMSSGAGVLAGGTGVLAGGAGVLAGGAALGQMAGSGMTGQMSNLGMDPSMAATGTTGTGILSNMGKYGKIAAGVALGAAALGTGIAAWKAWKSKGKATTTTEQMILNEKGELVPLSSWNNANAPYGYKITLKPAASVEEGQASAQEVATAKGVTADIGQIALDANGELAPLSSFTGTNAPYGYKITLEPATSLEEGLNSAQNSSQSTEPMVLNSIGQLVPLSSLAGTNAPFGCKVDPVTGKLVPAASLDEGLAASNAFKASQEAASASSSNKLKTAAKIAVGVAAGAAVAGAGVAAYKAWKKSKNSDKKDSSDKKDTNASKKEDSSKDGSSDSSPDSSSKTKKDDFEKLSPEEKKKTEEKIEDLEGDIKEVQEKIKSIEQEKQEKQKEYDDYKAKGKRVKMSVVEKEIEKLDESLKTQKENLEELQKDQKALKEKLNGDQSKSEPNEAGSDRAESGKAA